MLTGVAAHADSLKTADLAKLQDVSKREAEVARLAEIEADSYRLTEARIFSAPQADGAAPLVVVGASRLYEPKTISSDEYKLEKPEELFGTTTSSVRFLTEPDLDRVHDAVLMIFNSKGKEITPFGGSNYTNEGYFFDFDRDGILDRADSTDYSVEEAPLDDVSVFKLLTIEAKPRTLLEVIFNWQSKGADDGNDWTFTCFDDNGDGIAEIGFGPANATKPEDQRKFIFRWDAEGKRYDAGEIPKHSHILVLKPGETLASVAKAGGLGYPLTDDPSDDDPKKAPAPVSAHPPYVFSSLKDHSAAGMAAFFQGKKRRELYDDPEGAFPNRLPEKFWDLPAKQAAVALAEANRMPINREKWKLALDDRDAVAPPASGWLLHHWNSSSCYTYSSHDFALHFGVPDPSLIVFGHNSIGFVGQNPSADQPMHNVRVIKLTGQEAGFIADTVFWLDRIRTFPHKRNELDGLRHSSSTADGHARLTWYSDAAPREIASGTVWVSSSISGKWDADYNRTIFVNLAEFLMGKCVPERLGDRWKVAPEIDFQNLMTSTKDRLAPRVDAKARQQLSDSFASILAEDARSPLPPAVLDALVVAAGEEGLTDLLPALEALLAALPPKAAEDKEYEALRKRLGRDHFGNSQEDENTASYKKAEARYRKLIDKRKFLRAAILREPLIRSIQQLRLTINPADLLKAAAGNAPEARWAISQLRRTDPAAWATLVIPRIRKPEEESRHMLLETLAAVNPQAAGQLIAEFSPADYQDLLLAITPYHREHDPAALAKDIPQLLSLVHDRSQENQRRGVAISLLAGCELTSAQKVDFTTVLVEEIKQPQSGQYGSNIQDSAISALTRVSGTADHLELITTTPDIAQNAFGAGFHAILEMAKDRPDNSRLLADFVRSRFTKSDGMMNGIFFHALAYDLRGLAPDIAAFATEGPAVRDGDAAEYSGGSFKGPVGQRYHIAREITALWSEDDPPTLARLWTFFVARHSDSFDLKNINTPINEKLRELAAKQVRKLPESQRAETIDSAFALLPTSDSSISAKNWLQGLEADDSTIK